MSFVRFGCFGVGWPHWIFRTCELEKQVLSASSCWKLLAQLSPGRGVCKAERARRRGEGYSPLCESGAVDGEHRHMANDRF